MTQQNLQPITRELIGALRQTGAQVQENEPMSLHTRFQIGGPADVFATVSDERSLRGVLKLCKGSRRAGVRNWQRLRPADPLTRGYGGRRQLRRRPVPASAGE